METTGDTTEARLQQGHQPEKPEEPDPTTTLQSVKLCWCTTWYCLHHGYTFALLRFQSRWSNRCKRSACTRTGSSDKRAYPWPRSHVKSTQTYNIHQSSSIHRTGSFCWSGKKSNKSILSISFLRTWPAETLPNKAPSNASIVQMQGLSMWVKRPVLGMMPEQKHRHVPKSSQIIF